MTKRWVFKINTPWGERGSFTPTIMKAINSIHNGHTVIESNVNHEKYPDLFELVEEKSDEDRLADWLSWHYCRRTGNEDDTVARKFIAAGVDVKKLG